MNSNPTAILTNMARQLLTSQFSIAPDREAVETAVRSVAPIVSTTTKHNFSDADLAGVVRTLESLFVVEQGPALALTDDQARLPVAWYIGERRRPGPFMSRYLQKLAEENWPEASIEELKTSTARVLEVLGDPQVEAGWDWRGLVVGDVQSGKTAHYAGVINRAADAGYRVIVILAGMHNVLRLQTQKRLEEDFLGWDTNPESYGSNGRRKAIGVGEINPRLIVDSLTTAVLNGDFNLQIARNANFAPLSQPFLFVVKKNASILENLNRWIARLPDESRATPLLIVDDEADQASVDTGDQALLPDGSFDPDYDPTRINREIRKLLQAFGRSAYVAYTATPFANILMHHERSAQEYGQDLFPATFILSLTPPDDYFGPEAVFGTNDEGEQGGLPLIRHLDQFSEGWIPEGHDKTLIPTFEGRDRIPPSLEKAIDTFLLSCAARAARRQDKPHNSMLVHVSRFTNVHDRVHRQVQDYLDKTRALISGSDTATLKRMKELWTTDFEPTIGLLSGTVFDRQLTPVSWGDVRAHLADSGDKIRVIVANGLSKVGLEYDAFQEGLSVIAIGGDKLSRGLTLYGLTVSYFLRASKQYDSLLQMGRWFGYRRGYADLCRLYTTTDMEAWFRHIATANKDLRAQFAQMQLSLATPTEFGLRVAGHSIMNVTAANKQRYATERRVGYAGEGKIQTILFRDRKTTEHNAQITSDFVKDLGRGIHDARRPGSGETASGELWSRVPGRVVGEYLRALEFPPDSEDIQGDRLAMYIELQMGQGELTEWTVFLATGNQTKVELGDHEYQCVMRTPLADKSTPTRFIVKSILNPPDESIDLSQDEYQNALERTNDALRLAKRPETKRPSGPAIRAVRGLRPQNGLLLIYPMDPYIAKADTEGPLIGIVISFPDSPTALKALYVQNRVSYGEQLG